MKLNKIILIIIIALFSLPTAHAQKVATLASGEQVIIYSDHTWSALGQTKPNLVPAGIIAPAKTKQAPTVVKSEIVEDEIRIYYEGYGKQKMKSFKMEVSEKMKGKNNTILEYTIKIGTAIYVYRTKNSKRGYAGVWYLGYGKDLSVRREYTMKEVKNIIAQHYIHHIFGKY